MWCRDTSEKPVYIVRLFLGSGVFLYTAIASFCFRGTVALTTPISPAFVSGKAVVLIALFFRRLLLRFDPESSSRSTLLLFLCSIDSRSENLYGFFGSIEDDCCSSKRGSMVFEIYMFSSVLGSKVEPGRAFALTPAEAVVLFRWRSDYCDNGVCMPMKGWGFDLRTHAPLMVFRSRRGGLVTRIPCSLDYDTCHVHASRRKEEAPFWVRTMGLGPNRFTVWLAVVCLGFIVVSLFTFWAWSFGPSPFNKL
ncbi:hypothetical protein F2Q68_00024520 [Brassica cretica]|uniref:Uncharacterized protein n=1 Tax=Brassica cretica TaxID=69181 RepID=A0A8S9IHI9_BRACR|nr:hypothetical protein F2Q68_00024520 [Brassica cretica]